MATFSCRICENVEFSHLDELELHNKRAHAPTPFAATNPFDRTYLKSSANNSCIRPSSGYQTIIWNHLYEENVKLRNEIIQLKQYIDDLKFELEFANL
jgi:hypothetical protein